MSRRQHTPRITVRAPHGQRIYQHRPTDWQDRPATTNAVADPDGALHALAAAAYSASLLDHNQICRPFMHGGRLWICTALSPVPHAPGSCASTGWGTAWCREVLPLAQYTGDLRLWWEREPYTPGWTGRVVACGAALYVVLDHELHIQSAVVDQEPQQLALW